MGDAVVVPALLIALEEQDSFTRYALFTALQQIGRADPAAWSPMFAALHHPNVGARDAVFLAMRDSFSDVVSTAPFYGFIETIYHKGITSGCGAGAYCPGNSATREQMAVFLLKAEHGSTYVPPACTGVFLDVACPSQFADWIEQLSAEGITGGCGGGNYCPLNAVTRGQMAAFLAGTFKLP